jgi:hypothetical protein
MDMEKKTPAAKPANGKKPAPEIPAAAVAKMTKWNEQHPDMKFSWVVVGPNTPPAQQKCAACKKPFREGRVTRADAKGAYCGPKCQRQAHTAK